MFSFFKKKQEPLQLYFNTDIHCHVLPGIDDGSPDVNTSVELIERMKSWGITRIIATPHSTQASFENTPETMGNALALLKQELENRQIEIDITHSSEYRIDEYFITQLNATSSAVGAAAYSLRWFAYSIISILIYANIVILL